MKEFKLLNDLPKPLLEDIIKGQCIPIIGAGFSLNAEIPAGKNMPIWNGLGKLFAEQMHDYVFSNPIDSISAYCYEYSRAKLIEKLREWLLVDLVRPGYAHKAFAGVPFQTVITTNFDFLIERSFDQIARPYHLIIEENQLSINNDYSIILKIHGDLNHPNNLVATEEDYDLYINKNPLLATYISNLLISKTPLFIGYSLEDADFRQIWQIIGNRLGYMRRSAYIITLEATNSEISRYERRGVKVINLEGKKNEYSEKLGDLFSEIKDYWSNSIAEQSTVTRIESLSELQLPDDSYSGMCFFSLSIDMISYYKTYIFPVFEKYGFKPVLAEDIVSSGNNVLAKITGLIRKSLFVVVDSANTNWINHEINIALNYKKEIIYILDRSATKIIDDSLRTIYRPQVDFNYDLSSFLERLDRFVSNLATEYSERLINEPYRLLNKGEYRAAIISVISLLEVELKRKLGESRYFKSLGSLIRSDIIDEVFPENSRHLILEASKVRNQLVHSNMKISEKKATGLVTEMMRLIEEYL